MRKGNPMKHGRYQLKHPRRPPTHVCRRDDRTLRNVGAGDAWINRTIGRRQAKVDALEDVQAGTAKGRTSILAAAATLRLPRRKSAAAR
jgi:hypothetical protein